MRRRRLTTFVMCGAADHKAQTYGHRLDPRATEQEREAYVMGWNAAAADELHGLVLAART